METIKRLHIEESVPSTSPVPSWIQPLSPRAVNGKSRSNTGTITPIWLNENAGVNGDITSARRPSSPDILGAERDCISLVSGPSSVPLPTSRTSAWVSEQTTAAKSWPRNNSIPEDDYFVGQRVISNNLDTLALHGSEILKPPSIPYTPETANSRISWYTSTGSYVSGPRTSVHIPTSDQRTTSLGKSLLNSHETQESREASPPPLPNPPTYEDGLILADELFASGTNKTSGYQIGLDSSLYLQKGFCSGAQTYRVKGRKSATRAVMEYVSTL